MIKNQDIITIQASMLTHKWFRNPRTNKYSHQLEGSRIKEDEERSATLLKLKTGTGMRG